MRTTSSIGAIWMKVEVGFKPFPLRYFASLGLLIENCQMFWGLALVSGMRVASTPVTKLSFIKLGLCSAFSLAWVSELSVPVAVSPMLEVWLITPRGTIKPLFIRDIHMNFR